MTERPNIRRMQMPERSFAPETFDVKSDISADDWKKISASFEKRRLAGGGALNAYYPGQLALAIHRLDPTKIKANLSDAVLMMDSIEKNTSSGIGMAVSILGLRILRGHIAQYKSDVKEKIISALEEKRKLAEQDNDFWEDFVTYSAIGHAAYTDIPSISEKDWQAMYAQLGQYRRAGEWRMFAGLAAPMKILGAKEDLVTREDWRMLRATLSEAKKDFIDTDEDIYFLADLKVLAEEPKASMEQKPRTMPEAIDLSQ